MGVQQKASLILIKHGQDYLWIQRSSKLNVFANFTTFPGGMSEESDIESPFSARFFEPKNLQIAFQVGVRELNEEMGFDLISNDHLILSVEYLGHSISPKNFKRNYHLDYFCVELSQKPNFNKNESEIASYFWLSIDTFKKEYKRGKHLCVPVTLKLVDFLTTKNAKPKDFSLETSFFDKGFTYISRIWQMPVASKTLPPANTTEVYVLGDEKEAICVDPAPKDKLALDHLIAALKLQYFKAFFISHAHIDHYDSIDKLVDYFKVPVLLTQETLERIQKFKGATFLKGVDLQIIQAGDIVSYWQGNPVKVLDISGHAINQVGLIPKGGEWIFLSDCVDEKSSVVVEDMPRYLKTLKRLMQYNPKFLLTSHSGLVSKTQLIERSFQHRMKRVANIRVLFEQGLEEEEIFEILYKNLDENLVPYAKLNLKGYLQVCKENRPI